MSIACLFPSLFDLVIDYWLFVFMAQLSISSQLQALIRFNSDRYAASIFDLTNK